MTRRRHPQTSGLGGFDDVSRYLDMHESIRPHKRASDRPAVVLCHECMNSPVVESSAGGVRCEFCDHRRNRRMSVAKTAKGA